MKRRAVLFLLPLTGRLLAQTLRHDSLTGMLVTQNGEPALRLANGKVIRLFGDNDTMGVLRDPRVRAAAGNGFEVIGKRRSETEFAIDPIHLKAMYVHKGGERLFVTYWCDVCSIRTYTPGKCWCCQAETDLDLRERFDS